MGGAIDDEWVGKPDRPWALAGTQDQLVSHTVSRGYTMSRFEWPVHVGLLNNDCRWLFDEVQLMGPGLWTTSQLNWMRRKPQRTERAVWRIRRTEQDQWIDAHQRGGDGAGRGE